MGTILQKKKTLRVIFRLESSESVIPLSMQTKTLPLPLKYLKIIPWTRVGYDYESLDGGRGAVHQVGYHKPISNKRECNNCFVK